MSVSQVSSKGSMKRFSVEQLCTSAFALIVVNVKQQSMHESWTFHAFFHILFLVIFLLKWFPWHTWLPETTVFTSEHIPEFSDIKKQPQVCYLKEENNIELLTMFSTTM